VCVQRVLLMNTSVHTLNRARAKPISVALQANPRRPMLNTQNRDQRLLQMLEFNSFWQLNAAARQQSLLVVDLQLADSSDNFFPAIYKHLEKYEKHAAVHVKERDVYGLQARMTLVPSAGALPMSGGGLMLLPVWSQQLSGSSLIYSIRGEDTQTLRDKLMRIVDNFAKATERQLHQPRTHFHIHQLQPQSVEHMRARATAEVVWRAGVSHTALYCAAPCQLRRNFDTVIDVPFCVVLWCVLLLGCDSGHL